MIQLNNAASNIHYTVPSGIDRLDRTIGVDTGGLILIDTNAHNMRTAAWETCSCQRSRSGHQLRHLKQTPYETSVDASLRAVAEMLPDESPAQVGLVSHTLGNMTGLRVHTVESNASVSEDGTCTAQIRYDVARLADAQRSAFETWQDAKDPDSFRELAFARWSNNFGTGGRFPTRPSDADLQNVTASQLEEAMFYSFVTQDRRGLIANAIAYPS